MAATPPLILVIDDERAIRRFLRAALVEEGYDLVEASTAQEALCLAAAKTPSLVVLDLGLPDMDGLDLLRRLRQWLRAPIIVLSARDAKNDKVTTLDAGADDMKRSGGSFEITCDPAVFNKVQEALEKSNIKPTLAENTQLAKAPVDVDADTGQKVMRLMEALDDHDDVQSVHSNMNISEEMVAEMGKE